MPTVSWFINERIVEGHLEAIGNSVIVNRLEVPGVKREHLNSTYKCQASNTKLILPVEKTVRLELLCKYIPTGAYYIRVLCISVYCSAIKFKQNYFALSGNSVFTNFPPEYRFIGNKTHLHIYHFCPFY